MAEESMEKKQKPNLGLLGRGISYSLSPRIHNFSARLLGKTDCYGLFDIPASKLSEFIRDFTHRGGLGLNVTRPYKHRISQLTTSSLSSVNTLFRAKDGSWRTTSTDSGGFADALIWLGCQAEALQQVLIIGSGGVVDSLLAWALKLPRSPEIIIFRRSSRRDQALKDHYGALPGLGISDLSVKSLEERLHLQNEDTLLVQASSAPLEGDSLSQLVPALRNFKGYFMDLVYGTPSELYRACSGFRLAGYCDGLPMLAAQAARAQMLWWGQSAPVDSILQTLKK